MKSLIAEQQTTAIIGGGASGALSAVHLTRLSQQPQRILVIEPGPELGAGAAFSTDNPRHVLNTPARGMSAFENDPDDFVCWLDSHGIGFGPNDFVPRRLYRFYLQDLLDQAQRRAPGGSTVSWIRERVVDVDWISGSQTTGFVLRLGSGESCVASHVILAVGAPGPSVLASFGLDAGPRVVTNPWASGALRNLPTTEDVFIVGSGLTMIDVVLELTEDHRSPIHARSRHGYLPAVHREDGFVEWPDLDFSGVSSAAGVVRQFRRALEEAEAAGWGWRNVVSAARSSLPQAWANLPDEEKLRFIRHAGRQWEVHRHRMCPEVGERVHAALRRREVTIGTGSVVGVEAHDGRFLVTVDRRGQRERFDVGSLVDCSGPSSPTTRSHPLLGRLISRGLATADQTGRGIAVDESGALLGPSSRGGKPIYSIGWARSGRCFESTAIPVLRKQAEEIARSVITSSPVPSDISGATRHRHLFRLGSGRRSRLPDFQHAATPSEQSGGAT
jgi:uncharacterized NAD(P)/FAD-binding protein YdhS